MPTVGNGAGAFLPPSGGRGCGFNVLACFPEFTGQISLWLAQAQALYAPGAPALPPYADAVPQLSAAVVDALAAEWAWKNDAGRSANELADAVHALERDTLGVKAATAAALGATAIGATAEGVAAAVDAVQDAAEAHAAHAGSALQDALSAMRAATEACTHPSQGPCYDAARAAAAEEAPYSVGRVAP